MNGVNILSLAGIRNSEKILDAFKLLISLGLKLLHADEGSLLIYRKEQNDLQFAATVGNETDEVLVGKSVPVGKGITGMAAMTGEVQTASRASGGNLFTVQDDGTPNTVIAAPLMLDDELIGVITAVSFDAEKIFSSEDCMNYSMLAELGAVIINQEQMIANYTLQTTSNLTRQADAEMKAAQEAVSLIQNNPKKVETILQLLSLLNDLK